MAGEDTEDEVLTKFRTIQKKTLKSRRLSPRKNIPVPPIIESKANLRNSYAP